MKIRINNPRIDKNESTLLSTAIAAAATSSSVKNNEGFSADDYIVVGKMGDEVTELRKIASVSGSNIIVTDVMEFAHSVNTPITFIDFNQAEVHSASSKTGTYTALTGMPIDIEVDQTFTEVEDSLGASTTWYKIRLYNSTTGTYSDFSDAVQGTGYVSRALRKILDKIYLKVRSKDKKIMAEDDLIEFVNDAYQQAINKLMKIDHKRFLKKGYVEMKNSYDTGTIALTDGGTTVTGTDTVWDTTWTGKKIQFGDEGYPYEIASIESTTSLTLTRTYDGAGDDLSGESYTLYQDEYDIIDASDGEQVEDFRKVEQVFDEDGNEVHEFDIHRTEDGYYLKKDKDSLKFCVNYVPNTTDYEGKWLVRYLYQPAKLDTMGDEPEMPLGFDSLLVNYGAARIKESIEDYDASDRYDKKFEKGLLRLTHYEERRGNKLKGWRLDIKRKSQQHDQDWVDEIYSRKTIS